jgi:hypothetical protein
LKLNLSLNNEIHTTNLSKMIVSKIDNKKGFQIYIVVNLIVSIMGFSIGILSIRSVITQDWSFIDIIKPYLGLITIFILFGLMEVAIKPSYIETTINEREIIIRTFKPNIQNGLRFILMLGYQKHLKELRLSQQEYNDYKLFIDRFGLRKILMLQKINKSGVYETSEINISLLGQKKFTNLILSIDRLKGKINLN